MSNIIEFPSTPKNDENFNVSFEEVLETLTEVDLFAGEKNIETLDAALCLVTMYRHLYWETCEKLREQEGDEV